MRIVSNTGAYGNHGGETLYHACSESVALYRCPNKKIDAYAVYTNTVPSGAIRGYGLTQTIYAVECAMDELARALGMDPFELRQRNVVDPGDAMVSLGEEASDAEIGSYGLDQCLDLVRGALARGNGVAAPDGDDWLVGQGHRLAMHDTAPPTEHRSEARISSAGGRHLRARHRHGGVRQRHHHPARARSPPARWARRSPGSASSSRTPTAPATTPAPSPAPARLSPARRSALAAEALRERILDFAARTLRCRRRDVPAGRRRRDLRRSATVAGRSPAGGRARAGICWRSSRKAYGSPRSVAFNVQGFRIAVHRVTGEIAILQSVHAADAGTVINPMQLHGQVEGAVAQGIGWALYERIVIDDDRNDRQPARSATTASRPSPTSRAPRSISPIRTTPIGPLGAKGMGECPINPVAPALANALEDATGVRFRDLPFRPDLIYRPIFEKHGAAVSS